MEAIANMNSTLSRRCWLGCGKSRSARLGHCRSRPTERAVPTVSFTLSGQSPRQLAARLAEQNIFAWDGHAYAVEVVKRLGLAESGGVVRVGAVHTTQPPNWTLSWKPCARSGR